MPAIISGVDISPENFVGSLPTISELSYNIATYDIAQNYVEIVNEHSGAQTLATTIPELPFYVKFSQIIVLLFFQKHLLFLALH